MLHDTYILPCVAKILVLLRAMARQVCAPALGGRPRLRAGLSTAEALCTGALCPSPASAALAAASAAFGARPRRLGGACKHIQHVIMLVLSMHCITSCCEASYA